MPSVQYFIDFDKFLETYQKSSLRSKEIKLVCEVEKIMIILSLHRDGSVKISELSEYFLKSNDVKESQHS